MAKDICEANEKSGGIFFEKNGGEGHANPCPLIAPRFAEAWMLVIPSIHEQMCLFCLLQCGWGINGFKICCKGLHCFQLTKQRLLDFWCTTLSSILVLMPAAAKLFISFLYELKIKVAVASVYTVFIGNIMFGVTKMLLYLGPSAC
nr:hypothetical protein [Vibrio cholerae]